MDIRFHCLDAMDQSAYAPDGQRKYLNSAENMLFLDALPVLPEDRITFCLVLYFSGARMTEVLRLTPKKLEPETQILRIQCLKKRSKVVTRRVAMPDEIFERLEMMATNLQANERFWKFSRTTGWRIVKSVMRNANISGIRANSKGLRHAFGVRGIMNEVPGSIVQEAMGHENFSTTAIYLRVHDEESREFLKRTWQGAEKFRIP